MIVYTIQSLLLEMIQMISEGINYLKDLSNQVESLQIVLNIVFIAMLLTGYEHINVFFAVVMVCLSMIKLNILLRIFADLGPLVLLIAQCIKDTRHFVIYLVIWIVFFV
jgi:hypothetical protein